MDRAGTRIPGSAITWRGDAGRRLAAQRDRSERHVRPARRAYRAVGHGGPSAPHEAQRPADDGAGRGSRAPEKVGERQSRYEEEDSGQYRIVVEVGGEVSRSGIGSGPGTTSRSWRSGGPCFRASRDAASRAPRPPSSSTRRARTSSSGSCTPSRRSTTDRRTRSAASSASRWSRRSTSRPARGASCETTGASISEQSERAQAATGVLLPCPHEQDLAGGRVRAPRVGDAAADRHVPHAQLERAGEPSSGPTARSSTHSATSSGRTPGTCSTSPVTARAASRRA